MVFQSSKRPDAVSILHYFFILSFQETMNTTIIRPKLYVEQLYTNCLAEAAYYIESNGEAAIIDPLRETEPYLQLAASRGARIKYVLETHFHADFVSGHVDLAAKSGARIVFGPNAKPAYEAYIAEDGESLILGDVSIKVLHTPGHTMESSCFLLIDEEGDEVAIFTGDTLFIGDVGRPDLAVKSDLSREDLAGHLYDSLRNKIMPLPDEVLIYPGHGAGSACGKMMSDETVDTLGHQKKFNYSLRADMSREEFIREVTEGLAPPPQYFPKNALINKTGYEAFDQVMAQGLIPLSVAAFEEKAAMDGSLILDCRSETEFAKGYIPGAIFIGIDGNFAPWAGALIEDLMTPILIVADPGREEEVVRRLSRVGYDNCQGYLKGGINDWLEAGKPLLTIDEIGAEDFAGFFNEQVNLLDVRKKSEFNAEHIVGADNFPLDLIHQQLGQLSKGEKYYLHCAGGYRSLIAASILRKHGFQKIVNIRGGFRSLSETSLQQTDYVCPKTML